MKHIKLIRLACFCLPIFLIQSVTAEDLGTMLSGYTPGGTGYDSAWSVFVGGDFTVNTAAARASGRVFVRNNMNLSGNYELGGVTAPNAAPPDGSEVLIIGNDLLGSGQFNVGSSGYRIRIENTYSSNITFGWYGSLPPLVGGVDNASADLLIADLKQKSAYWGSLSSTPGGSISTDAQHQYISADGINGNPKLWVFTLDHDIPNSSAVQFSGFEPGDTILINVNKAGVSDTFSIAPSSFTVNSEFSGLLESNLLWNFPDATTVQLAALSALPGAVLVANSSSTTTVSMNAGHSGRFATCGNLVHAAGAFENYPFDGVLPDLPAKIFGYLFLDQNNDQIRNAGDAVITNAPVSLIVGGIVIATTNSNADGYYEFTNVPAGGVTIQAAYTAAHLVGVPASSDPMRNRAVAGAGVGTAVIEYTLLSGSGVLSETAGETLNFGYDQHPLSTQIDLRAYTAADGRVMIDIFTVNENGNHPIEIFALIEGEWALVATVTSEQIVGFGSHAYTVEAPELSFGASYYFRIVDESGHIFESGLIEVVNTQVAVEAITLMPQMIKLVFPTKPGRAYQVMVCEALGAPWVTEYIQYPTTHGWSELSNQPFTVGAGDKIEVLVPRNRRAKAFFKIIEVQ